MFEFFERFDRVHRQPLQRWQRVAASGEADRETIVIADDGDVERVAVEQHRDRIHRLQLGAIQIQPLLRRNDIGHDQIEDRRQMRERSEEHTSELQSLMRISYAVFCLTKLKTTTQSPDT